MEITRIFSVSPSTPGDKAADTPDYQLDFDPGAACLGELFNDILIGQGVHLDSDVALVLVSYFVVDKLDNAGS